MSFYYKQDGEVRYGSVIGTVVGGIVALFLAIALLVAWPFEKVPNGYTALSYGGGIIEGQHFQGERPGPSGLFFNGWGDKLYLYPTTLRTYIVSSVGEEGDREGSDAITAIDANGVEITYEVAVYFKLNLDVLEEFHQSIGLKYHAWCDPGATNCSDGWEHMLNDTLRQQLENALQSATRTHQTEEFLQSETIRSIQTQIEANLKENVNEVLGSGLETEFFCGPDYVPAGGECPDFALVIKKPQLPDEVIARYREVQEAEIKVQTRQEEVKQAELEAEAIAKRQAALESCGQTCILYEAIKSGKITFWVIPDAGSRLTIPASGGSVPGA